VKCPFRDQLFDSAFFTITHKHACKEEAVQQEGNCSPHDDDTGKASNVVFGKPSNITTSPNHVSHKDKSSSPDDFSNNDTSSLVNIV
jgi:hypothetical protein